MKNGEPLLEFRMKNTEAHKLKFFLIDHLNKIYCAKAHLVERLPEILDHASFIDLKQAIKETIVQMEHQVAEMDEVYTLLDISYSFESCNGLIISLDNAFMSIQNQSEDADIRDLFIISYLYLAESMEMASFQILHTLSGSTMNHEIRYLLQKNFEEAKAERMLLLLITKKYFK